MSTEFVDNDGTTRLTGQLVVPGATPGDVLTVQADESVAPAAGGGSQPHTQEVLTGNNVSIANGDPGELTWDTSLGPDSLLDLSTPGLPEIKTTGTYAVAVQVQGASLTAGGQFDAVLSFDWSNISLTPGLQAVSPAPDSSGACTVVICGVWYMEAGAQLEITVNNLDGVASRNFKIGSAIIQRLA